MLYLLLIAGIALSALLGLAAFVTGIVLAIKKRWRATIISAVLMVVAVISAIACGGILVAAGLWAMGSKATTIAHHIAQESAEQQSRRTAQVNAVKALSPPELTTPIDEEFWTYDGFRDWYRVPVRYPYSIECIDTLDHGALNKNHASGKSADPNTQETSVLSNITYYSTDASMLLYRHDEKDNVIWGIFTYDTDLDVTFPTRDELLKEARARGFKGRENLESVRDHYDQYWGR